MRGRGGHAHLGAPSFPTVPASLLASPNNARLQFCLRSFACSAFYAQRSMHDARNIDKHFISPTIRSRLRLLRVSADLNGSVAFERREWMTAPSQAFSDVCYAFGTKLLSGDNSLSFVGLVEISTDRAPVESWLSPSGVDDCFRSAYVRMHLDAAHAPPRSIFLQCPSCVWREAIAPLQAIAISGWVWLQGESNVRQPELLRTCTLALINEWRNDWHARTGTSEVLPFIVVQLRGYASTDAPVSAARWAQSQLSQLPRTLVVVSADLVNVSSWHSSVGERIAHAVLAEVYNGSRFIQPTLTLASIASSELTSAEQRMEVSDPARDVDEDCGTEALLRLCVSCHNWTCTRISLRAFPASGIRIRNSSPILNGFEVLDRAGTWMPAVISLIPAVAGDVAERLRVEVVSSSRPVALRYGWADFPALSLFTAGSYPIAPFTLEFEAAKISPASEAGAFCAANPQVGLICRSAEPGEVCYDRMLWMLSFGLYHFPGWFPALGRGPMTPFDDVQCEMYRTSHCPLPCVNPPSLSWVTSAPVDSEVKVLNLAKELEQKERELLVKESELRSLRDRLENLSMLPFGSPAQPVETASTVSLILGGVIAILAFFLLAMYAWSRLNMHACKICGARPSSSFFLVKWATGAWSRPSSLLEHPSFRRLGQGADDDDGSESAEMAEMRHVGHPRSRART